MQQRLHKVADVLYHTPERVFDPLVELRSAVVVPVPALAAERRPGS